VFIFGLKVLLLWLNALFSKPYDSASEIIFQTIVTDENTFVHGFSQSDDVTMLFVRYLGWLGRVVV